MHSIISSSSADWIKQEIEKGTSNCPTICAFELTGGANWICSGTNYTFTLDVAPPPGVNTNWTVSNGLAIVSSTNTSVTVTSNGYNPAAIITATLVNNCGADIIMKKTVGAGQPGISLNFEQKYHFCYYEAVASPGNSSYTYEWSEDGVNYTAGTNPYPHKYGELTPGLSQTIWVRVTTDCGVLSTSSTFNIQNPPSGCMRIISGTDNKEAERRNKNLLQLYPNPATNTFTITGGNSTQYIFYVRDVMGRTIINGEFNESKVINCSDLLSGIYLVEISTPHSNQKETRKLVIQ